jgi:hypothetical protein
MDQPDSLDLLYVTTAILFQIILIVHFALRKWRFALAMRLGPLVYALSIPAVMISIVLLWNGKPFSLWLGGFLYLAWGIFGYWVEYTREIQWRSPIRWSIFVPYILLYLSTEMFYWFPLALIWKPLWYAGAVLFIISTTLNATSHQGPAVETHGKLV